MDLALILSAGLLGLVGAPHCTAMCSAPCAAVTRGCGAGTPRSALAGFMTGRLLGYAAGGAAVATGVLAFGALGRFAPVLRPLWTVVHAAVLALGLWLLCTGRQPSWWNGTARVPVPEPAALPGGWQRMRAPARAGVAGAMWLALPCGLLQSALLIAALASTAVHGAAAMAAFAITSSVGLGPHSAVPACPAPGRVRGRYAWPALRWRSRRAGRSGTACGNASRIFA